LCGFDPSRGINDLENALCVHLACYDKAYAEGSNRLDKVEEYARNSAFVLFQFLTANRRFDDLLDIIARVVSNESFKLDPLEDPLAAATSAFLQSHGSRAELQRYAGRLEQISRKLTQDNGWHDRFARDRVTEHYRSSILSLRELSVASRRG
jgi:hypothetical protein